MNIAERIHLLEGKKVESVVPHMPTEHFAGNWGFIRVLGVARPLEQGGEQPRSLLQAQQSFLTGLYAADCPWGFLITGGLSSASVYFVLPGSGEVSAVWEPRLSSCFPCCEFLVTEERAAIEKHISTLPHVATLTGNPSVNAAGPESTRPQLSQSVRLEELLRNMGGRHFAYLVLAKPVGQNVIKESFNWLASEERELVSTFQRRGSSEENNHPQAKHCLEIMQAARSNHQLGLSIGMWDVEVYLRTRTAEDLYFGSQALHAAFSGAGSRPQPIRVQSCTNHRNEEGRQLNTRLNTIETVAFTKLPEEEVNGYRVREYVRFAVSAPVIEASKRVDVGIVIDAGKRSPNWFSIPVDDLARHALIVGNSGSGKTNTCQLLLLQLWIEYRRPWMVIDPSMKSAEYRRLLRSPLAADLRIFTLGDESGVPFRLNPLEVLPGINVQTTIDSVLSLFGAAFGWVSPMPEALNLAVHRLYLNHGWDLVQGTHPKGHVADAQPTLSDLLRLIPSVVKELGYPSDIESTINGGLITRLSSLISGGKGRMLNSGVSVPFDELLSKPTILELSAIGNDDEKAFVICALLMRLAQYRQSVGLTDGRLAHVLLIEEAHRILAATPPSTGSDVANPRAKAVETFCNLTSEIRAYGQSIICSEQIPSKLVSDLLKNVNLKIVHRLPAEDDRRLVGATMNLSPAHERFLSTLPKGEAVVFAEGRELACHVAIPNVSFQLRSGAGVPSKAEVVQHMKGRMPQWSTIPMRHPTELPTRPGPSRCPSCVTEACAIRPAILRAMADENFAPEFQRTIATSWDALWEFGLSAVSKIPVSDKTEAAFCLLMNIAAFGKFDQRTIEIMKSNLNAKRAEMITAKTIKETI